MLYGRVIRLRSVERSDLPQVVAWFNDPATRAQLARSSPMSLAEEERWFETLLKSTTDAVFLIESLPTSRRPQPKSLGLCGIHKIDWKNRSCVVGIVIGDPADRGQGAGTDAMATLVRHATHDLNLHRVELDVFPDNVAAVRSYEKVGFVVEGTKRDAMWKDGAFRDLLLMAVLSSTSTSTAKKPPSALATQTAAKAQKAQKAQKATAR